MERRDTDRDPAPPAREHEGGSRAPEAGGDAAGSAGGPAGTRGEVPQDRSSGKGEDEAPSREPIAGR